VQWARRQFPAIARADAEIPPFIFSDNAAGGQIPQQSIDSITDFITDNYALAGAFYPRSNSAKEVVTRIRTEAADFLGAGSMQEISFGLNATVTLRLLAVSLAETLKPGDEIIISGLEHEANVAPWLQLQRQGVTIRYWPLRGPHHLLQAGDLKALLNEKTRVVAVTAASNLLGTTPDIRTFADLAHECGAIIVVDGVHFAPHRRVNVSRDEIDFFVCSGYKLFGTRVSISAIKPSLIEQLPNLNHYFLEGLQLELGAQNYEGIAAFAGVFHYFRQLANQCGINAGYDELFDSISTYENALTKRMLEGIADIKGLTVFGLNDPQQVIDRVATFSLRKDGQTPDEMATKLTEAAIACRHGHMYAPRLTDHLRVTDSGGVVRLSLCHYNTEEEVDRILDVLAAL
jgi:cysteine desulfurase family protein (TIGR01976 family)